MTDRKAKRYTKGEELANSLTHGITAVWAVWATVFMTKIAEDGRKTFSAVVFGLSMVLMYTMSTLYHTVSRRKLKETLRIFDHASIPLLIAGSYTPFCLITLKGTGKGVLVAGIVWRCCILSVTLNFLGIDKFEKLNLALYVLMGWSALLALKDIIAALPTKGFYLLLGGGISYTVGIIFYKMTKVKYMHSVWHCFVTLGTILHFLCVVKYVL